MTEPTACSRRPFLTPLDGHSTQLSLPCLLFFVLEEWANRICDQIERRKVHWSPALVMSTSAYRFAAGQNAFACHATRTCHPIGTYPVWARIWTGRKVLHQPRVFFTALRGKGTFCQSLVRDMCPEISSLVTLSTVVNYSDRFRPCQRE